MAAAAVPVAMKAVVYRGVRRMRVEDVPQPKPKRDEVIVRFKAGSICGSDLHSYKGEWTDIDFGTIVGHDACGQTEGTSEWQSFLNCFAVYADTVCKGDPTCASVMRVSWGSIAMVSSPN